MNEDSLGMKCPMCAEDSWFHERESWNVWVCRECGVPSTLSEGKMDIVPSTPFMGGSEDERAYAAFQGRKDPLKD